MDNFEVRGIRDNNVITFVKVRAATEKDALTKADKVLHGAGLVRKEINLVVSN